MKSVKKTIGLGEPVYIKIEAELQREITSGQLNPGEMLPSESTLMSRFEASRETVRRSLKELEGKGLAYSRPGKGYFVAEPEHNLYSFYFDDQDQSFESEVQSINTVKPEPDVVKALDLFNAKRVIKISRIITHHNEPVAYDEKYLPYDKGEPLVESEIRYAVFQDLALLKSPPFAFHTRMEISAINADETMSRILKCQKGAALVVLCRFIIGQEGRRLGYGKKYLTPKWGSIMATSGYMNNSW